MSIGRFKLTVHLADGSHKKFDNVVRYGPFDPNKLYEITFKDGGCVLIESNEIKKVIVESDDSPIRSVRYNLE